MEFKTDGSGSDIAGRFSWKHESVDPNRIVLNYGPNGSSGVQIELNWPENGARDTVVVHYLDSSSMGDQTFYRVR